MGGEITIRPGMVGPRCVFELPALERYRRLMANYADQWEAADRAKRVDHLRYAWRKSDPKTAIAALT